MADIEDNISEEQKFERLDEARVRAARKLNIDLKEPKQERRIEALRKLHEDYVEKINVKGLICRYIIDNCEKLIEIYKSKQKDLEDIKWSVDKDFTSKKIKLEGIYYRNKLNVKELESQLVFNKKLLRICDTCYKDSESIDPVYRKKINELENLSWENWLKTLDINKELRNTIIGFENRKALREISREYIDYYLYATAEINKCFEKMKDVKKKDIIEYYSILSHYNLPIDKRVDFKMFLQKKIESKFMDAIEIKSMFGEFADLQREQIDSLVSEVRSQYERDQQDISTVINHYKQFLINKQVLFTNESEKLVIYFKKRYIEKIDLFCSRFQMFSADSLASYRQLSESKISLIKKLIEDEHNSQLNKLKIDYSKKLIPFLDNFWYLEKEEQRKNALDEERLNDALKRLKISKIHGLKGIISEFEESRKKIKDYFDKKLGVVMDVRKFSVKDFDSYLMNLKDECDAVCCEIVNMNARFWTRINAEFNCEARRALIRIRQQYSPYIDSWKRSSKPWMNEYLQNNLNQELLKAVGEALVGLTPESELYIKLSKALLRFNEKVRKIQVNRDKVEAQELLNLNTLPSSDDGDLRTKAFAKIDELKQYHDEFQNDYSKSYNSLLDNAEFQN